MINFTIYTKVKPKQSFKYSYNGHKYIPKDIKDYAKLIQFEFKKNYPNWQIENFIDKPLKVEIIIGLKVPESFNKKKKQEALEDKIRPLKRPDVDNCSKAILDSLNGIVYSDDKQIVELLVKKYYANVDFITIIINSV